MSKQVDYDSMCPTVARHKLGTWLQSVRTWVADMAARQVENRSAIDTMKTALENMCLSDAGVAIGTAKTKVKTAATVTYLINGEYKSKAGTDDFWTLTGFNCENGKYNKCLLCIDSSGNGQIASGTQADTAAEVSLPGIPVDYTVVAMLQVHPTGTGDFTGGTTDLDDGTVVPNAAYTDLAFHPDTFGEKPAALSASTPNTLA